MDESPQPTVKIETTSGAPPSDALSEKHWLQAREIGPGPLKTRLARFVRGFLARLGYDVVSFARYPAGRQGVGPVHIREAHHQWYHGPWAHGRDAFEVLLESGVKPEHRVLDFGCGTLRAGVWIAAYLDADRYFGIDAHWASLEAAAAYELPLHGLEPKRPRLLWDRQFAVSHFGVKFDRIVANSVLGHLSSKQCRAAYSALRSVLAPGGKILCSRGIGLPGEEVAELGFRVTPLGLRKHRLTEGATRWVELEIADQSEPPAG